MDFWEQMTASVAASYGVDGNVVYEIGSDPSLRSAELLVGLGAKLVIASNLGQQWFISQKTGVVSISADIRYAGSIVGPASIDGVYGVNILEHIPNLEMAIATIHSILKPGGWFFLHGHPIWTGPTGHHSLWEENDEILHFYDKSSPLPPWAHLFMTEGDLTEHLRTNNAPDGAIRRIVRDIFHDGGLNRVPLRMIDAAFRGSGLIVDHTHTNSEQIPDDETLDKIRASPWWDEAERYDVRQVTYMGRKGR